MKILLLKFFIFILPILLIAKIIDKTFSDVLKKSESFADSEYPVWNCLYEGKINSDIVIYGSSRAWRHINPNMISDSLQTTAYNLGVNGHSFLSQYFRHLLLLKYNKKPKVIIQTLDVTSFDKKSDFYNPDQYLPYMLNNHDLLLNSYNLFQSIDYTIPLLRYYGKKEALIEVIEQIIFPSNNYPIRDRGFHSRDLKWNEDMAKASELFGSFYVSSDTSLIKLFEKYLIECKALNIKVIFVNTPVYIEGQSFVRNWVETMSIYSNFSKKYGIPYFDYSKDSISLQKDLFYNSQHLNSRGAQLFTNKLINDLKESNDLPDL